MRYRIFIPVVVLMLLFSSVNIAIGQQIQPSALKQIKSLQDEKVSRTPAQQKLNSQLWYAIKMDRGEAVTNEVPVLSVNVNRDNTGKVTIEISAQVTDALLQEIKNAGGEIVFQSVQFNSVTARIPLQALEQVASLPEVKSISPYLPPQHGSSSITKKATNKVATDFSTGNEKTTNQETIKYNPGFEKRAVTVRQQVIKALTRMGYKPEYLPIGSQTSNGDVKHNAAIARTAFSVNGAGVKIGVLSDSYNSGGGAAAEVLAGDLPGTGNPNGFTTPVTVLVESGTTDEGRAMLQIIHDLAPGAQLYFATANGGQAAFATNILALQAAGCSIICDDVFYLSEPVFQDGIIAQAVNTVTAAGVIYFSSAGNQGNKNDNTSSVWEGDFLDGGAATGVLAGDGQLHNFGSGTSNALTNNGDSYYLFWSDPQGASANDYDLYILNAGLTTVMAASTGPQTGTQNPIESINSNRFTGERIVITLFSGVTRALHLNAFGSRIATNTAGQTHGHSSAAAAFSVAATFANGAGAFTSANNVEVFSSDGPRRKFYNPNGTVISGGVTFGSGGGTLLQKPDITAADGVATSVPGFGSFFGTSAAAPHAAAITALLKQLSPGLTPAQIRTALISTAIDNEAPGVDRDAGAGIVMAMQALQSVGCGITCPANITVSNTSGQCGAIVNYPAPTTSGSCGTITASPASGSFFPVGTTTVTVTSSTGPVCTFTVTVQDTQAPSVSCPVNITIPNTSNQCGAIVSFTLPSATDNCPGVTVTANPASGSFFPVGTTTVTVTASDLSPNSPNTTCTFTVTVQDTQAPSITCPANITVPNTSNQCGAIVSFTLPSATDNCPGVTVSASPASGSFFSIGTTTVTITASDLSTDSPNSTCAFTVTVQDTQSPSVTCPANMTVANDPGQCGAIVSFALPSATDNCPGVSVITSPASGSFFPVGTTTVTVTASDLSPDSPNTTCTFTVTVIDTEAPSITCPATVNVNTNASGCTALVPASSTMPVVNDNCAVTLVEWSVSGATPALSGFGNLGNYLFSTGTSLVSYRVSDAAGNNSICTFNVVVTNAVTGAISGTTTVVQNIATSSAITFTGSGGAANYTFTYNVNGGATQTVSTTGGSNVVIITQSNALQGTFVYNLLSVTDANGCAGTLTAPASATITIVATGTPDLTNSQFFTTTQIAAGGTIDEVIGIRNVGSAATSSQIVFTVTNYSLITGLSATPLANPTITIGFTTYTLSNASWTITSTASALTFMSNAGVFINPGATMFLGIRITRAAGANGTVTHSSTITGGTGGGETPVINNSISNTILKN